MIQFSSVNQKLLYECRDTVGKEVYGLVAECCTSLCDINTFENIDLRTQQCNFWVFFFLM